MNPAIAVARSGFWGGMIVTTYVNVLAAPSHILVPVYLVLPIGLACLTEAIFLADGMNGWLKVGVLLTALIPAVLSFEHFYDVILAQGGSRFSATFTSAGIDGTMLVSGIIAAVLSGKRVPTTAPAVSAAETVRIAPIAETLPTTPKMSEIEAPKPRAVGTKREEANRVDVARMTELWPELSFLRISDKDRLKEVRTKMACGGPRAQRLVSLYLSHLDQDMMEESK